MELFPASSDDQWTLIQRVIDDCDYYLVIVGGRYGSTDGCSFEKLRAAFEDPSGRRMGEVSMEKVNQMHEQIRILDQEVARLRELDNHVPANLARGPDEVILSYTYQKEGGKKETGSKVATWNVIFGVVACICMDLPTEDDVRSRFSHWISKLDSPGIEITATTFEKIKIQCYSLGLIRMEILHRHDSSYWEPIGVNISPSPPQPRLCWVLTEAGRRAPGELLAEKRPESGTPVTT